jgi:putative transposase
MYFITICAQDHECVFGKVENGIFQSNQAGAMIEQYWRQIGQEFENIKLGEYVIMPNHLHGIIDIFAPSVVTIGDIICAFKSRTTNEYIKNVKQNNWKAFNKRLWQRNYYEHIIRNEAELIKIRNYIKDNPLKWEFDSNNLSRKRR